MYYRYTKPYFDPALLVKPTAKLPELVIDPQVYPVDPKPEEPITFSAVGPALWVDENGVEHQG